MPDKDHKRILVTSALRYATGPVHIGHIAGAYLSADIFVRYQRLKGAEVIHIGGTDEYGVPVTVKAEQEDVTPQQLVDRYHKVIKECYDGLGIEFDNFSRTTLPIHTKTAQDFFLKVLENGYIETNTITQLYCERCQRYLPDRYVEGICPNCGKPGARGDQCESCGRWLEAVDLIEPACKICGGTPVPRETTHWFLKLSAFQERLTEWLESKTHWKDNVRNFCAGWLKEGLRDRAITRDLYWGIPVPLEGAEGKVLYVWFDAPIGYISSTKEWAERKGNSELWKDYWCSPDCRIVHFIGKDNIVFHAIVWPAMLMGHGEFQLPDDIPANEFMNIHGEKLSTSRNLVIWVSDYLKEFKPDPLRYYIAANAPENSDSDFSWRDFQARNNNDLADVLGNLVNRTLTFAERFFDGIVPERGELDEDDRRFLQTLESAPGTIGDLFATFRVRQATSELMNLARAGNKYFNDREPWRTRKENPARCATTINLCIHMIRSLAVLFHPILPFSTAEMWDMLGLDGDVGRQSWEDIGVTGLPGGHKLGTPEVLFQKIDDETIERQEQKLGEVWESQA